VTQLDQVAEQHERSNFAAVSLSASSAPGGCAARRAPARAEVQVGDEQRAQRGCPF